MALLVIIVAGTAIKKQMICRGHSRKETPYAPISRKRCPVREWVKCVFVRS